MSVILGQDVETGQPITVSDTDRCGGLYLLGKPRTGKSTLLISMALQDMANGHGLLFIDPHSDAIANLLARIPSGREKDVILLDPDVDECAFGINPLTCKNPRNYKELTFAYGLARDVFLKVFGDPVTGELGILLNKYLRNCLYPLLENPGHTLVDIEPFLTDKSFRNRLLQKVKMNPAVVRFWQVQYEQLPYKTQIEERESTLNRLSLILAEPYVKHIVGQVKTTIDFAKILQTKKIVLLRMPAGMDEGVKTFIGALIISQLLKAVWLRQKIPKGERDLFALYCDEFQHFATPDFAKLFTQTGKFKIMPAVAHQERLGQFRPQDPNRGATLAAPCKVLFGLSPADGPELARDFSNAPPTEIRLEPQYTTSQNPVTDLLRAGHKNPQIKAFITQYLRPLQYKLEDVKEEMEFQRLIRTDLLDQVALDRIDQQEEGLSRTNAGAASQYDALERMRGALETAHGQTAKMFALFTEGKKTRLTLRSLNDFFAEVMEGGVAPGHEKFSQFLISRVHDSPRILPETARVFELYIVLTYGDPQIPRAIPFNFAKTHGLYPQLVGPIQQEADKKVRQGREEFIKYKWDRVCQKRKERELEGRKMKQSIYENILKEISDWKIEIGDRFRSHLVIMTFIPILEYPSIARVLAPYLTDRFAPFWKTIFGDYKNIISEIYKQVGFSRRDNWEALEYFRQHHPEPGSMDWYKRKMRLKFKLPRLDLDDYPKGELFDFSLLKKFEAFLEYYGEGALVALALLMTLREPRIWREYKSRLIKSFSIERKIPSPYYSDYPDEEEYKYYWLYNALYLPVLVNHEPLEIILTLKKLEEIFSKIKDKYHEDYSKYFWWCPGFYDVKHEYPYYKPIEYYRCTKSDWLFDWPRFSKELVPWEGLSVPGESVIHPFFKEDLQFLNQKIEENPDRFSRVLWWESSEKIVKDYLRMRALDIARFGKGVADRTFPQPSIKGATAKQVEDLVIWMVSVLQKFTQKNKQEKEEKWYKLCKDEIQKEFDKQFSKQLVPVPDNLAPQTLSGEDIEILKGTCLRELDSHEQSRGMRLIIDEFARFCTLLAIPENHIKVPSGQYIEREHNARTFSDMENEMAWQLTNLPKHTAYVKLTQEKAGRQLVLKREIQTYPLPPRPAGRDPAVLERFIVERSFSLYYQKRGQIEQEIWQRHKDWFAGVFDTPPPTHTGSQSESRSSLRDATPEPQAKLSRSDKTAGEDAPPPTSSA